MRRESLLLLVLVTLLAAAGPAAGASPDPFGALGLVRFDNRIKAPDFALPDLHGQSVGVPTPVGSATLLVFWATW